MGYFDRLRSIINNASSDTEGSEERSPLELDLISTLQSKLGQDDALLRYAMRFTGQVQGVGFRWTNQSLAHELGCTGWVHNESDGSVTMEIQGTPAQLIKHLDTLHANYRRMRCHVWLDSVKPLEVIAHEDPFRVIGY